MRERERERKQKEIESRRMKNEMNANTKTERVEWLVQWRCFGDMLTRVRPLLCPAAGEGRGR